MNSSYDGPERQEGVELHHIHRDDKYGFADKAGVVVIPCQWEWAEPFSEGLAGVKDEDGKLGFIDKTGEVLIPCQWKGISFWGFREGLAMVQDKRDKWGFIDKT